MDRKTFYGIGAVVSSLFLIICTFLPYIVTEWGSLAEIAGTKPVESYSLFGTTKGIIIMLLSLGVLFTVFVGLKDKTGWLTAATVIYTGYSLGKDALTIDSTTFQMSQIQKVMDSTFGYGTGTGLGIAMYFGTGYYLMIVAVILVGFFGIAYTMSADY